VIAHLKGRLVVRQAPSLVVDVHGVGYECEAPMSTFYELPALGAEVALYTHLVVRDDAHVLYAFGTEDERRVFRALLKVSGVGPKIALGVLSGISIEAFLTCLEAQDPDTLVRIPGVGRKTAERILIDLRDRVQGLIGTGTAPVAAGIGQPSAAQGEAYSALVALGYRPAEVVRLLKAVDPEGATTEDLIRRALRVAAG
jgi:holliday junction DNA helicase RuvA